ncbi:PEP/pyruvate-binding domain-containing protein [Desulfovibrio porci]|uniref:PEP/pyruvate-binding domain-containing protein n=1 Tax=Desulfovibrio porci TaxID=2605782 RepID=UPI002A80E4DE|nr:PEP/pyruvate-binding domain-containing protein [Desulfovibrio porci]MDY3809586.1 PEP/pyruvate-binding domain-containing protein [Desulfovibrio porci]
MAVLKRLRRWLGRGEPPAPDPAELAREEEFKVRLRERCARFRRLLSANKSALEAMSDVEERLAGVKPFGMDYVRAASTRTVTAVFQMVRELNALSDNGYASLQEAFDRIRGDMERLLALPEHAARGPLILPLADVRLTDLPRVGGKMANLGELAANVGLDVPDGFAVTVAAYYRFMEYNGLRSELERRIQATDMRSLDEVFSLSAALQQCVLAAPLPPDLEAAVTEAVEAMKERAGDDLLLALRSSAVGEDALGVTFAGQYRSELNVPPEEACEVWKEIVASKYAVTAMSYRYQRGIPDDVAPMSVGVLAMVRAGAGGVAYSRDPVAASRGQERVVLNAVPGLPQAVVDGAVTPDVFVFSRENPPRLLEKHPADAAAAPSLTAVQAAELARVALALEEYYNEPQDVEWALEAGDGRIMVLQSRPLREADGGPDRGEGAQATELPPGLTVLAGGGVPVSPGVGMGPAFVARKEADMLSFPEGGVLVVERAYPRWATLLARASGLVSETGGMAGHLASVAREYRLPAVFSLPDACRLLENAGDVTLDANRNVVLAGRQAQLIPPMAAPPNLMAGSPVYLRLEALAQLMTPLHLLDPDAPEFAPQHCRSLHDITRFCHEKAVRLMFDDDAGVGRRMGKQLKAGVKLQYWVVDMGGGFTRTVGGPVVDLSEIASAPMLALWEGMVAVPWAGPPSSGAAGFMSVVFESAMNPELESTAPTTMAERNFFIIGDRYMILQARYGYHFCTVECLAGEDSHENFVNFQFKGGAADRERRRLRARMLAGLLEGHGFRADVKDDSLFAVAEGFDAVETLRKTRLLGYLLIHSRQVDMIMRESAKAEALRKKLAGDMDALAGTPLKYGEKPSH